MNDRGETGSAVHRGPRLALVAYAVGWLVVVGFVGIVVRLQVPNPTELLRDVADRRALWITANVVLIAQQTLLFVGGPCLVRTLRATHPTTADAVGGLLGLAVGALVASGVCHAVLGAHLADQVTPGPGALDPDLVRAATTLHALGDTTWFIGLGALLVVTAGCSAVRWSSPDRWGRLIAILGAATVVAGALQFGWFFDHVFGLFAAPAMVLQSAWLVAVGASATWEPPDSRRRGADP